LHHTWMEYFSH